MRGPVLSFALAAITASTSLAEVRYQRSGDAAPTPLPPNNLIPLTPTTTSIRIFSTNPTTESIPALTITGATQASSLDIEVTSASQPVPEYVGATLSPACLDFGGLSFADAATRDKARATIATHGALRGSIIIGQLIRLEASGGIQLNDPQRTIEATSPGSESARAIESIVCGTQESLSAASITATSGDIGTILVPTGRIGDPGAPVTINAANIQSVTALEVHADITTPGVLNELAATAGGIFGTLDAGSVIDFNRTDGVWPIRAAQTS
ncbi:MAG TPA: hypothetical protein VHN77_06630, partial [Phycisphaerales bacterium]|nr:hypothetical protein [Phycisphaerales bacterium]